MLALTILLSAAAGVNAIIGGEVHAVQISNTEHICADDCVYDGIYLAQKGYFCPVKEVVRQEEGGKLREGWPYDCRGAKPATGVVHAPLKDKEAPKNCKLHDGDLTKVAPACISDKDLGSGGGNKILQLSEVAEMLKSASANTADNKKPAPPKSKEECAQIARQKYLECHDKNDDFGECQNQGAEVFQNCRDGK
ncbi:hypothetical protein MHUMG1_07806 [Metarhizium humberi]|uniref:Uncharacterized protein n=1 Tax=Metarhizium humberi TaxID=2596975 RepID=A0A9P8M6H8_9HYPO|nr:hypothetical protein MHUMG1_07806 [Metarhizium humberi]